MRGHVRVLVAGIMLTAGAACSTASSVESHVHVSQRTDTATMPPDVEGTECVVETIEGIVRRCCQQPRSAFWNCTNYTRQAHMLCLQAGVECHSLGVRCSKPEFVSHATLAAYIPGRGYCIVDPENADPDTSSIGACERTLDDLLMSHDAACMAATGGVPDDCDCRFDTVSASPVPTNTDPAMCKREQSSRTACLACCARQATACAKWEVPDCAAWQTACNTNCRALAACPDGYRPQVAACNADGTQRTNVGAVRIECAQTIAAFGPSLNPEQVADCTERCESATFAAGTQCPGAIVVSPSP